MSQQIPEKNKIIDDLSQDHVVSLFALVGMSITSIMGIIALFNHNYKLALMLFFASLIYLTAYYAFKKQYNIKLSSAITTYSLYLLMFYLVYTGGVENTGPLWIYIVAPVTFFIHRLKRGLIDISIFVVIITIIMYIPSDFLTHAVYTNEFKLRLIYSFLTITFLSGLYEYSRERSYKRILKLSQEYQQLAHYDPLTQLSNRRNALITLKQEQSRVLRNKEPLSLILCDVDHFKQINDQYGHNAGDAVLIDLAHIFTEKIREQDYISRWGGEEFLFILPQTTAENANVIAEKILSTIAEHITTFEDKKINITVSMGISEFENNQSIDEVINNADKYLYQAKNAGRNQIFPKFNNHRLK